MITASGVLVIQVRRELRPQRQPEVRGAVRSLQIISTRNSEEEEISVCLEKTHTHTQKASGTIPGIE